jgi:hypothetical protein
MARLPLGQASLKIGAFFYAKCHLPRVPGIAFKPPHPVETILL